MHIDLSATEVGPQIVRAYLSRQHFEDVENSCPVVALPTDVGRSGKVARAAFETVFKAMVDVLARSLPAKNRRNQNIAQGEAAMCIGGMIVARTVMDRAVADRLRAACISAAMEMAGWAGQKKDLILWLSRRRQSSVITPGSLALPAKYYVEHVLASGSIFVITSSRDRHEQRSTTNHSAA